MTRGMGILAAVLAIQATMTWAAPSPKPAAAATLTRPPAGIAAGAPQAPAYRLRPMSAEGNAIAQRMLTTPDPRTGAIQAELVTIRQQKLQMLAGASVDIERLESMLRREEALQTEYRGRQNDRLIALLRALPEPDRVAFLQVAANPQRSQTPKPADPAN